VIAKRVVVSGRVQGVWFRESTRRTAEAQGVRGWVRNNDDGTVEAVLEGPDDAVERVVDWCRRGPSRADVARVDVYDAAVEGLDAFIVK
jgi:acylphosphatase